LSAQECWNLDYVAHFGYRRGLVLSNSSIKNLSNSGIKKLSISGIIKFSNSKIKKLSNSAHCAAAAVWCRNEKPLMTLATH